MYITDEKQSVCKNIHLQLCTIDTHTSSCLMKVLWCI